MINSFESFIQPPRLRRGNNLSSIRPIALVSERRTVHEREPDYAFATAAAAARDGDKRMRARGECSPPSRRVVVPPLAASPPTPSRDDRRVHGRRNTPIEVPPARRNAAARSRHPGRTPRRRTSRRPQRAAHTPASPTRDSFAFDGGKSSAPSISAAAFLDPQVKIGRRIHSPMRH